MPFPKNYDIAVNAVFNLTAGGPFTNQYNNRADLDLELKNAAVLGFMKHTVGATTTYYPAANITTVVVTDI
jgi:hypothetical protein